MSKSLGEAVDIHFVGDFYFFKSGGIEHLGTVRGIEYASGS